MRGREGGREGGGGREVERERERKIRISERCHIYSSVCCPCLLLD